MQCEQHLIHSLIHRRQSRHRNAMLSFCIGEPMDHQNDISRRTKSGLLSGTGLLFFATSVVERYLGQVGDLERAVKEIHAKKTRNEDARKRSFSAK